MVLLREQILGKQRFDWPFASTFATGLISTLAVGLFREMASEGGKDLSWFWRGWYLNN